MSGRVIAGIGMRRDCAAEAIVELVRAACDRAGRPASALAAPLAKQHEAGLHEAARRLALPLLLVDAAALEAAQTRCVTRSAAAQRALGVASVAEGSALAAAGPEAALILPRIAGATATCALAATP